ncbi:phosphoglycerol transferase MdoB-like AlkP superfamily enzyme [Pullulanibacillus pueri]|uniref:Sulfatase N-terminal domain-containing protein n=1 Tax=Pullulanibacillus pueri TaxID=1437324 RepID=A0A8J2ZYH5_9BACL|nr:LTA synthase family protein [Pullulanibacillus pueri]MBM7683698.1 phosphoglycerol transferase MdoB-like AlkP superfamily enzyme [Pullulanibacillus pueri]GGH85237.1 hypothetical protein GCM10007096_30160 [Pullulanibacillus pueri]
MKFGKKDIRRFLNSQYIMFSIILTLKAVLLHGFLFHDYDFIKSFILEGCYILFLLGLVEFLPVRIKSIGYFFADAIITTLFASIVLYVAYFNTVPTYFALFQLGQVSAISDSVFSLLNPLYLLMYIDIIILIIFKVSKKLPFPSPKVNKKGLSVTVVLSIVAALVFFSYYKGITIANPVLAAGDKGIFNYELLNIYKDPNAQVKPLDPHLSIKAINEQIDNIKGITIKSDQKKKLFGAAKGRNVIVIQMESFQNFLLNLKVDGQEVTPNLNALLKKSMYFPNVYQQVGPGNTSDAEYIMNTSLFPQSYSATSISEGNRQYNSLPKLLKTKGYNTMTFHADELKFWNRDELYPALGFNHFYERPVYGEKDIIGLGPSDDVLYSKGLEKLQKSSTPFYSMFISMSSHHPYKIPDSKKGLKLPSEYDHSKIVGDYLQAQHYTDEALGRFIQKLKDNGLWDNAVILFYGDHFGLDQHMLNDTDRSILKGLLKHPYSEIDRYNIPFIITMPGITQGEVEEQVGGQLDFLPTLTNLLGIDIENKLVHFGQDLLNTPQNTIGMRYYMPAGSFINQSLLFTPKRNFEDGSGLAIPSHDPVTASELKQYKSEYEKVIELENLSDSYVQSLPHIKISKDK